MARNSNLKWEVAAWAVFPSSLASNLVIPLGATGITSQDTLSIIDSGMLEGHDSEQLTMIRLVGSIRMSVQNPAGGAAATNAAVKVRLHKGFEVSTDGLPITTYADPWDPFDAEEEFVWERTMDVGGTNPATYPVDWRRMESSLEAGHRGDHPFWSEIDITTKRTVRPPEVLGLTFAPKGDPTFVLHVWAWLRVLIAI